ncbi:MAG: DEAD/DEAH box helicase, partial [Candidatus Dormibacteraceae bacterium]
PWTVRFLLQSAADPSLIVPASEVWASGPGLSVLGGVVHQPEEALLADLGRAARLWPQLEAALDAPRPTRMRLDTAGAHHFLKEVAPTLVQAGLGVMLPSWWQQRSARIGVRAKTSGRGDAGVGLLGLEGLVDYRWQLAIGDEDLSTDDLRQLAALKVPLVQVRGHWVELQPDRLQTALAFFERHQADGARSASIPELLRIGLGLDRSETGLPVLGVQAEGWLGKFLHGEDGERVKAKGAPEGFVGTLRPYQERGLGWLGFLEQLGLGACLADDMGLGKTVQLLALVQAEHGGPTLLVCPMSVVGNWQREAERFTPGLRVVVHHGGGRSGADGFAEAAGAADLVITTYALIARDRDLLATVEWRRVVLDEAQNVKNSEAKQAQAVRSLPAASRVALTGTPVENRLSELWSILDFCNPGLLGTKSDFRARFAVPVERYRDEAAADTLQRLTRPFVLRRLKTDRTIISDLPDKLEMKVYCNITREQATLYQAVLDDMLQKIEDSEGIKRKGLVLSTMLRLKQVLNHPALMLGDGSRLEGRSGKLSRLEGILEEAVAEGDRVLCFTQFAEMGALLKTYLEAQMGHEVLFLYGGTSKPARDAMVERFQSSSSPQVFILSLKAGGTGLNLTAANNVVHFDRWWNPAVEDQATDRAFRIGQRRNVQVRKLICVGTLEERIDRMLESKRELAERIVGAGEGWLTELSTDELRSVIALSKDAVAEE